MVARGAGPAAEHAGRDRGGPGDLGHDADRPVRPGTHRSRPRRARIGPPEPATFGAVRRRPVLQALRQHAAPDPHRPDPAGQPAGRVRQGAPRSRPADRRPTAGLPTAAEAGGAALRPLRGRRTGSLRRHDPGQPRRDRGADPAVRQRHRTDAAPAAPRAEDPAGAAVPGPGVRLPRRPRLPTERRRAELVPAGVPGGGARGRPGLRAAAGRPGHRPGPARSRALG